MEVDISEVEKTYSSNEYSYNQGYLEQNPEDLTDEGKNINLRIIKDYENHSDIELVDLYVRKSDEMAFNEIFERYYKKAKGFAQKILTDVNEAEDIAQEVFATLLKSMSGFRGESKFSTWLYSITFNSIRMRLREKKKDRKFISIDDNDQHNFLENVISINTKINRPNSPEYEYINQEFAKKLHQTLEQIPKKYKDVFILRDMKQLSNQEVADELGVSLAAVKSRVYRARQYLKTNFKEALK